VPFTSGFAIDPTSALSVPLCACTDEIFGPATLPQDVHGESEPLSKPGLLTTLPVSSVFAVSSGAGPSGAAGSDALGGLALPEQPARHADTAIAASKR
jgi:hypothetical protein